MTEPLSFESNGMTHVGMVRELNEDSFIENTPAGVWAVADGMGGHEAGEVASAAVANALSFLMPTGSYAAALQQTQQKILDANSQLVAQSVNYPPNRVPGTTVAALVLYGRQGAVVWAGDSRIYRIRGGGIEQVTRDHSHVQELIDQNLIRAEEAEHHPMANVITRAIGIEDPVALETLEFEVMPGDTFLLCSDGLSRLVENHEMAGTLAGIASGGDKAQANEVLINMALQRGASDNVTVICVSCEGDVDSAITESTVVMTQEDLDGPTNPNFRLDWSDGDKPD